MKNLIAPIFVLVLGPAFEIAYFSTGLHNLFDRKALQIALVYFPLGGFFIVFGLRFVASRWSTLLSSPHGIRLVSSMEYVERILMSLPVIYLFFFALTTK